VEHLQEEVVDHGSPSRIDREEETGHEVLKGLKGGSTCVSQTPTRARRSLEVTAISLLREMTIAMIGRTSLADLEEDNARLTSLAQAIIVMTIPIENRLRCLTGLAGEEK
jgi:hypothetical protein